jgi:hypothetical protein
LVDPVVTEVVGDVENFHVSEAQRMERVIGGSDVRAAAPGTASAIEDDRRVFGQRRNPGTQLRKASVVTRCADVFGIRNMSLYVERAKTDLQDQRFRCGRALEIRREVGRLNKIGRRDGCSRFVVGPRRP